MNWETFLYLLIAAAYGEAAWDSVSRKKDLHSFFRSIVISIVYIGVAAMASSTEFVGSSLPAYQ